MTGYLVRYGAMLTVAPFKYDDGKLIRGQKVIVRTDRGLEAGEVVCAKDAQAGQGSGKPGVILRKVTREDQERLKKIEDEQAPAEMRFAREKILELKLPMKVILVEHLFAGDKIVFYFLANGRVDFRKLVRELARAYQTRIELKQVGVRDEAKLLADYEHCGRQLCCRTWIKRLQPVTMRLAKNQKATLDPSKISGGCGRLMCCLRYENKTYEDLRRNLPNRKQFVRTKMGDGDVLDFDVLSQTVVLIEKDTGKRFLVHADDIIRAGQSAGRPREAKPDTPPAGPARNGQGQQAKPPAAPNESKERKPSSGRRPGRGRRGGKRRGNG